MIDPAKHKKVKCYRTHFVAQCPACHERGRDRKGDHLIVYPNGKFGCVCYPGIQGEEHRSRIFMLICAVATPGNQPKSSDKPLGPTSNSIAHILSAAGNMSMVPTLGK